MRPPVTSILALLVLLVSAGAAPASQDSELHKASGLVRFHAGDHAAALTEFDAAVAADATDLDARYYRGVTRGRLRQTTGAIEDLRAVLAAQPTLDRAALELGIALVDGERDAEAIAPLEQAKRAPELASQAAYFLGIAELRLGQNRAAAAELRRAGESDTLRLSARYYEGVARARLQHWVTARDRFEYVVATDGTSKLGQEATAFLDELRPWHLYGSIGFDYDSNVQLAPSDESLKTAVGISDQGDGALELGFGAAYMPWLTDEAQLWVGYEFFQSLYFDLSEYDLQDHRANVVFTWNTGSVQVGVLGRYDFYLRGPDRFLQEGVIEPWVTVYEEGLGRTELFLRERWRGFDERPYRGLRDAFNHSPGFRQFVDLPGTGGYVFAGYRFDRENSIEQRGDAYSYDGHEAEGGIGWTLPAAITTQLSYAFRYEDYDAASDGRRDDDHRVTFWVRKHVSDHLAVRWSYLGDFNDSRKAQFDYERHLGSVAMEVRF